MSTIGVGFGAPILPVAKREKRERIIKRCSCGSAYSSQGWNELRLLGVQHLVGTGRGEMRQCRCESTLLVRMTGKPTVRMAAVDMRAVLDVDAAVGGRTR